MGAPPAARSSARVHAADSWRSGAQAAAAKAKVEEARAEAKAKEEAEMAGVGQLTLATKHSAARREAVSSASTFFSSSPTSTAGRKKKRQTRAELAVGSAEQGWTTAELITRRHLGLPHGLDAKPEPRAGGGHSPRGAGANRSPQPEPKVFARLHGAERTPR